MIWNGDRIPGVRSRHALGIWLPSRKLASSAFVPGMRSRQQLRGARPYWYVFDFALGANGTLETRNTCPSDFHLLAVMVSNTVDNQGAPAPPTLPGCRLQVFDSKRKKRLSVIGNNDLNFGGSARNPFMLRRPYKFHAGATILMRAQNLKTVANTVQVVLYGVQDA